MAGYIGPDDLRRHPELAALVAQKLGADAPSLNGNGTHHKRTERTTCRRIAATVRQAQQDEATTIAWTWVAGAVLAVATANVTAGAYAALSRAAAALGSGRGLVALAVLGAGHELAFRGGRRIGRWAWPVQVVVLALAALTAAATAGI